METPTPTASPYLSDLLKQWSNGIIEAQKEAVFQKDMLDPLTLAAHGNRLAMRERRKRDLETLVNQFQDTRSRWDERLQRIEEWKTSVIKLRDSQQHFQGLIDAGSWLEKARNYQESFIKHINRGAVRLEAAHQIVHYNIEAWQTLLQERQAALAVLIPPNDPSFFVSRARKQPELDFLAEQAAVETALGLELQGMRHLLNHLRARVRRAMHIITQRTYGAEIFYEIHKQELISELKTVETVLDKRREEILSEALAYEGGRHVLRKLHTTVQNLRCLEDLSK